MTDIRAWRTDTKFCPHPLATQGSNQYMNISTREDTEESAVIALSMTHFMFKMCKSTMLKNIQGGGMVLNASQMSEKSKLKSEIYIDHRFIMS